MRWLAFVFCLLASVANAQIIGDGMGSAHGGWKVSGGGGGYTGPGDVVASAKIWYGARGYSAAFASPGTGKALNYRRASDNSTQDGVILTSGDFDIATANIFAGPDGGTGVCTGSTSGSSTTLTISVCTASATLHAGDTLSCSSCSQPVYIVSLGTFTGTGAGASGTVTLNAAQNITSQSITSQVALYLPEAYDQTGGTLHALQATAAKQPQLLPVCKNGKPCISFVVGGAQVLVSSGSVSTTNQPFTESFVLNFINTGGAAQSPYVQGTNVVCVDKSSANTVQMYAGSFGSAVTVADSTWHAHQAVFNGASSVLFVDGTSNSQNPSTGNLASGVSNFGGTSTCGNVLNALVGEFGLWGSGFSGGSQASMHTNQSGYWGTP